MLDSPKVPINAKIPQQLHDKLLNAVSSKKYHDKTECIIKGLEIILDNTHQESSISKNVLQEEIRRITLDLQEKNDKINELQSVIRKLPDPIEFARIGATNEGLRVLLVEKDASIERLEREVNRLDSYAYYFKTKEEIKQVPSNTQVIRSNTGSNGLIEKRCKECGNPFFTGNNRKEYCSGKCKTKFGRKKRN